MNRQEALDLLNDCRAGDQRDPFPILQRLRQLFVSSSSDDREVLNQVVRDWLVSDGPSDRYDGAWLTDELQLTENLDLIRKLRDEAESKDDSPARFDWEKYSRIAARLSAPTA